MMLTLLRLIFYPFVAFIFFGVSTEFLFVKGILAPGGDYGKSGDIPRISNANQSEEGYHVKKDPLKRESFLYGGPDES